uniref:Beta/gamma crystallin 'Greek key' domain-containing protein n=1 Tax=Amphiprion ocellaris TaxID=80972 RepID=A0AAQ5Y216_AMPOC
MSSSGMNMMSKIIFYEERNFQGRSYECMSDCADMSSYLSRCHSCRVERGCFMVYDRTNFMGNQYFMRRGEYADYMSMMGMSDCIRSCRMIPMHRGSFRMRIYERENFQGQMHELMEDCDNIMDRYGMSNCMSCNVMEGQWLMYEQPHFRGRMMYMRPGEYRSLMSMMGMSDCIRSCRMIPMHRGSFRMRIYERENFQGQMHELMEDCDNIMDRYGMSNCMSCNVMEGQWLMYEQPHFRGRMMYMRPGEYRSLMSMGMSNMSGMRVMSMRRIMDSCY